MENPDSNRKPITRVKNAAQALSEIGRIPPQATDIEQVVLGAMMLESRAINDTIDILSEKTFYDVRHQHIFKAIRALFAATNPIDLVTVTSQLQKSGELELAGGTPYVASLTNRVASAAHVQHHAHLGRKIHQTRTHQCQFKNHPRCL